MNRLVLVLGGNCFFGKRTTLLLLENGCGVTLLSTREFLTEFENVIQKKYMLWKIANPQIMLMKRLNLLTLNTSFVHQLVFLFEKVKEWLTILIAGATQKLGLASVLP